MRARKHLIAAARLLIALAGVGTAGCTDSAGPVWLPFRRFELPAPSTSLDPDSLRFNTTLYICDRWLEIPPATPKVVVDVWFSGEGTGPTFAQLRSLADAGAEVGYLYPFEAARVRVATAAIPELYRMTQGTVYTVPDVRRYDWLVGVIYSREPVLADEQALAGLGGRVTERYVRAKMLFAVMPVSSLSRVRSLDGVTTAQASRQYFCNVVSRGSTVE